MIAPLAPALPPLGVLRVTRPEAGEDHRVFDPGALRIVQQFLLSTTLFCVQGIQRHRNWGCRHQHKRWRHVKV